MWQVMTRDQQVTLWTTPTWHPPCPTPHPGISSTMETSLLSHDLLQDEFF